VIAPALAIIGCFAAILAALYRLRRVDRALSFDPRELARALGRPPTRERLCDLEKSVAAAGPSWESALLGDVLAAKSDAERRATVNEHAGDLAYELDWGSRIPQAASRMGLLFPLCVAFVLLSAGARSIATIGALLVCALVGLAGPLWVGRLARARAEDRKAATDVLILRVLEAVDPSTPPV
jgi:hypothetical protein